MICKLIKTFAALSAAASLPLAAAEFDSLMKIRAGNHGGAFVDGEALRFELVNHTPPPPDFRVLNWRGETLRTGQWPNDGSPLILEPLPHGHYRLETALGECSFAVLTPPEKRKISKDTFFALDTHFSWSRRHNMENGRTDDAGFDYVAALAQRIGVPIMRDRIVWGSRHPEPGKISFDYYPRAMEAAKRYNIELMDVYHDAPKWTLSADPRKSHLKKRLPDDLFANYEYNKKLTETFKGKVTFWEFWNEQDHGFSDEAAWDYAANMKAAYLGFKAGDPTITVLSGGFCQNNPKEFCASALLSDLGQYFDILNYHNYMPRAGYRNLIQAVRESMRAAGIPDTMPIWFSEIGTYVEGFGKVPGLRKGLQEHSYEQELTVGREIPKILLTIQQLGVQRAFWYNMMTNNEQGGQKSWGLVRYDSTIKASYTAFATMTDQHSAATLLGMCDLGRDVSCYLYAQPDGTQSLVLWMEKGKRSIPLPGNSAKTSAVDFLGGAFPIVNGAIALDESPVYVRNLSGLKPKTKAVPAGTPGALNSGCDKSIVMKVFLPRSMMLSRHREKVDMPSAPQDITIDLFNFDNVPKTGSLRVSNAELEYAPATLTIPPMGKISVNATLTAKFHPATGGNIVFNGTFNHKPISRLTIPVIQNNPHPGYYREKPMPRMMESASWRKNSSGKIEITEAPAEEALKFSVEFPAKVDRWVYPVYQLKLPADEMKGAIGFAVDVKALKTGINIWDFRFNMRGEKYSAGGEFFGLPTDDWQTQYYFFSAKDDPAKVTRIELGFNPGSDQYAWMIRNPRLLFKNK